MSAILKCLKCGNRFKVFGERHKTAKYCSLKCRDLSYKGRRMVAVRKSTCNLHSEYSVGCVNCKNIRGNYIKDHGWSHGRMKRGSPEHIEYLSQRQKRYIKENGHPLYGKHLSIESRIKISIKKRTVPGTEIGLAYRIRRNSNYKRWICDVLKRDNYTWQICGRRGGRLCADHFPVPFSILLFKYKIDSLFKALNNKELWDINNGRTLCEECHRGTDTYGYKFNHVRKEYLNA